MLSEAGRPLATTPINERKCRLQNRLGSTQSNGQEGENELLSLAAGFLARLGERGARRALEAVGDELVQA